MTTASNISIEVRGLRLRAQHGWYEEERLQGNDFEVDVVVELTPGFGKNTVDELSNTLNYEQIYSIVVEEMAITSKLLEEVVERIEKRVRAFGGVHAGQIRLCKLHPSLLAKAEKVCVRASWGDARNSF